MKRAGFCWGGSTVIRPDLSSLNFPVAILNQAKLAKTPPGVRLEKRPGFSLIVYNLWDVSF
jgi:hypothetical protein